MNTVIKRVVCKGADYTEVIEWCKQFLGDDGGWATSVLFGVGSTGAHRIDPVIVLYDNLDRPIEQIELVIALMWG